MATVLHPKGNRITVLRDPPKTESEGGIQLTGTIVDHLIGTVLEVGQGVVHPHAYFLRSMREVMDYLHDPATKPVKVNDRVLYSRFAGTDATVGGKNICILEDREIIGVLEGEGE
jgi:co-chaperonin GroES (HSP10)